MSNANPSENPGDPSYGSGGSTMLWLGSVDAFGMGVGVGGHYHGRTLFPLRLSLELEQGKGGGGGYLKVDDGGSSAVKSFHEDVGDGRGSAIKNVFHGQPVPRTVPVVPHLPAMRPRVRARRGRATDPHSISERLRREKIAERIRRLQDLVPSVNKTDRAAMLDEIVDYVKFLRLRVM